MKTSKGAQIRQLLGIMGDLTNWEAPNGLLQRIAKEIGCSREYVRQQAVKMHFEMSRPKIKKPNRICLYCGKKFYAKRVNEKYCSPQCRYSVNFYTHNTLTICEECGLGFINPNSRSAHHLHFCSKRCQGRHLGKTWGNGGLKRYAQI